MLCKVIQTRDLRETRMGEGRGAIHGRRTEKYSSFTFMGGGLKNTAPSHILGGREVFLKIYPP